jgi:2-polyprenyl-3-methyl-5-hydroxy-6-metoxy-1,4-benzoquinol methylase
MNGADPAWLSPMRDLAAAGPVSNPFRSDSTARRYARARPYYHRAALDLACNRLGIGQVHLALDIGGGTGLSSRAVRDRADHVVALDARGTPVAWAHSYRTAPTLEVSRTAGAISAANRVTDSSTMAGGIPPQSTWP